MQSANEDTAVNGGQLYIDLLEKILTNTLYAAEPDVNEEGSSTFILSFLEHYVRGPAITMLPKTRIANLRSCVEDVLARDVPGDLIETGVWRGGATILMRALLKVRSEANRRVWVADSFEGLPRPDPALFPIEARAHAGDVMTKQFKHFAASIEDVKANFAMFDLLDDQVCFLKGWFKDTLPNAPIERIAILRLDGDYYESTRDALTALYDRVSVGGYIIVDDYGEDDWTYCRRAIDEFRAERGITDRIVDVDRRCSYWQRSA